MRKRIIWYLADSVLFAFSFSLLVLLKYGYLIHTDRFILTASYVFFIWIATSVFTKKQDIVDKTSTRAIISDIAISNVFILISFLVLGRIRPRFAEIRLLLIYLFLLVSTLEYFAGLLLAWYNRIKTKPFLIEPESEPDFFLKTSESTRPAPEPSIQPEVTLEEFRQTRERLIDILSEETNENVIQFIEKYIPPGLTGTSILSTTTTFNILNLPLQEYDLLINLKRVNDIKYINKFFESVNSKLKQNGLYIASVETNDLRKKRILAKYPRGLNLVAYIFDFLVKRVAPKLPVTKKLYFFFTRGQNRVMSRAETLGRLYSCGFEIIEDALINIRLYLVGRKIRAPYFDTHPTYGPVIRLKRLGRNAEIISVYKFRTMYAYSEYLQAYVYEHNKLQSGGKFSNDFRVTTLGKIFRKLWIDELPMAINILKGDMKIVGVRPLSQHYYSLYTEEVKTRRIKFKPGLIPPFYVDLPKTLPEIMQSEMNYLTAYEKHPFLTDCKYFWKAVWNILIKKARSQ